MRTLRELAESKSEKVRLQAALRMSEILLEHQRIEERRDIAIERAAARKAEAEASTETPPEKAETAEDAAERFIERHRQRGQDE